MKGSPGIFEMGFLTGANKSAVPDKPLGCITPIADVWQVNR